MSKMLLVVECERPGTECAKCSHGSDCRTRPATAADVPDELVTVDQAARVLGVSAEDFDPAFHPYDRGSLEEALTRGRSRKRLAEAARRVREAEQAKAGGDG